MSSATKDHIRRSLVYIVIQVSRKFRQDLALWVLTVVHYDLSAVGNVPVPHDSHDHFHLSDACNKL